MVKITFVTQSSRAADNIGFSPERLINFYPEPGPQGAKGALLLRSVLGQESFASLNVGILRAMEVVNGVIYAVGSGNLYSISSGGVVTEIGAVSDDLVTTISGNGSYVAVACGGNYYVWDGSSLTEPTGGRLSNEGTVSAIDTRTIITQKDGNEFEWTDLADPTSRQPLNYATNGSKNDNTLLVLADRRELWFFGDESTEIYYNTGQGGANAFARINGGALETGILDANLAVKMDAGIFFIADDKTVRITQGMTLAPVSTPAVNLAIKESTPTNCFYYEDMGHKFCVVRFSDRPAWVYDISIGLWHERSTGVAHGAWEVVDTVQIGGDWYAGTNSGEIYKMVRNNADVNHPLKRTAISKSLYMDGNQFSVSEFELLGRVGESNLGRDAKVMLKISRDGGVTWEPERTRSMGDIGDRLQKIIWHGNGRGQEFTVDASITDEAELTLYSDANVKVI